MSRVRLMILTLAVTALVAAGCADAGSGDPDAGGAAEPGTGAEPPSSAEPGTGAVPEALDFRAPTVGGGELDATTLAGRPVAFWFWAAWCPRCAAAASDVKAVQSEYAGAAHVVGVAGLGSGESAMRDFVDRHELGGFPHLADDDGQVWQRFGVTTQEYFVLLDDSGEIVHEGGLSAQELRDRLASLTG